MRDVKVFRHLNKGMVDWFEILSDLRFKLLNGKREISNRSESRLPLKHIRSSEVSLVNLWKR